MLLAASRTISAAALRPRLAAVRARSTVLSQPSSNASLPQTPLFLRSPAFTASVGELRDWREWARRLALSVGSSFLYADGGPDSELLCRELTWVLEDAVEDYSEVRGLVASDDKDLVLVRLSVGLEDLYGLWKERVEKRRPFQYLVGCQHWRDMVLAVQEGGGDFAQTSLDSPEMSLDSYMGDQAHSSLNLEETELRLGLPGGKGTHKDETTSKISTTFGKRGFAETTVDLELNLPTGNKPEAKKTSPKKMNLLPGTNDPARPPALKAQVVGWPPVRSFRKNIFSGKDQKSSAVEESADQLSICISGGAMVKVGMDGAPYLRKIDLKMFKSYHDLSRALDSMFGSFTIRKCGSEGMIINGMRDYMNEKKLVDGSEYVPTYEDKDGDWMLLGDVPWEMFVDSCKRLRIMKNSEAVNGFVPRAIEKCKETVRS